MSARVAALVFLLASAAGAQELNLARIDGEAPNHLHVRTGAEYGLVGGVGYARAVPLAGRTVLLGGDLTVPWGNLDAGDWRLRASALVPLAAGERWKLSASVAPTVRSTSDDAARLIGLGVDVGAAAGYCATGWFAAAELGLDWEIATHVTSSDAYRKLVFADARDGWYAAPGGNFRAGLQGGVSLSRYDLVLRAGKLLDTGGSPPMLPLYATLTLDARW
jgi:hypothetical protein